MSSDIGVQISYNFTAIRLMNASAGETERSTFPLIQTKIESGPTYQSEAYTTQHMKMSMLISSEQICGEKGRVGVCLGVYEGVCVCVCRCMCVTMCVCRMSLKMRPLARP